MGNLDRAMAALAEHGAAKIHAALEKLPIWWWEQGEQRFSRDRWKTVESVEQALEDDPWLRADAIRLLAALDPEAAAPLALELVKERWKKNDLEDLAKNQAVNALWSTAHHLPLPTLLASDVSDHLYGADVTKVLARIPVAERPAVLLSLLPRDLAKTQFSRLLREVLALETLDRKETVDALATVVLEDGHPTQDRAAEWLHRGGSEPALRALVAYLERGGRRSEIRSASIGAAARLGSEAATRLLMPLVTDPKASTFERATCFDSIGQSIRKKTFPKDDATWIHLGLDALASKNVEIVEAARRMLGVMNKRAVDAAAAKPGNKTTKKAAARDDGWLDGFEADLRRIVAVLEEHGYTFAAKKPIAPASKTARKALDAFEEKHGVALPWSLRAFWERFASVDLREDTEGENDLPELGRLDPLVVVSLVEAERELAFRLKEHAKMPKSVRPPLRLWLAPEAYCKYDPDGDEFDELPLMLALEKERAADGVVEERNRKRGPLLSYLRDAVAAGGFLAMAGTKSKEAKAFRAKLTKGLKGF